jgi:hypothetical protein
MGLPSAGSSWTASCVLAGMVGVESTHRLAIDSGRVAMVR